MASLISKWCVTNWPTFSISWQRRKSLTNGTNPSAFCKKRLLWKGPEATQIHSSCSSIAFSEVHCKVKKKMKKNHKVTSSLIFGFSIISFYLFLKKKLTKPFIYLFIWGVCLYVYTDAYVEVRGLLGVESVLSFHCLGLRDWTQVTERVTARLPLLLSDCIGPYFVITLGNLGSQEKWFSPWLNFSLGYFLTFLVQI